MVRNCSHPWLHPKIRDSVGIARRSGFSCSRLTFEWWLFNTADCEADSAGGHFFMESGPRVHVDSKPRDHVLECELIPTGGKSTFAFHGATLWYSIPRLARDAVHTMTFLEISVPVPQEEHELVSADSLCCSAASRHCQRLCGLQTAGFTRDMCVFLAIWGVTPFSSVSRCALVCTFEIGVSVGILAHRPRSGTSYLSPQGSSLCLGCACSCIHHRKQRWCCLRLRVFHGRSIVSEV